MNKFNVIGAALGASGMSCFLYSAGAPAEEVIAFGVIGFTFSVFVATLIDKVW